MTAPVRLVALVAAALFIGGFATVARGQVAPSAGEIAAYGGLHAAAARGDVAVIGRLATKANVDARDSYGRTPLMVATHARQHRAMRALIAAGADLGLLESDRYDAVTIAAVANDVTALMLLLRAGARATLTTSRYDGTALIAAAHLGHAEVVRLLIAAGAPLDHVNNLNWTALIESIVLGNGGPDHVACLRALVDAGADVNIPDGNGTTPLALAERAGYAEMVRILKAAGAR